MFFARVRGFSLEVSYQVCSFWTATKLGKNCLKRVKDNTFFVFTDNLVLLWTGKVHVLGGII